MKRFFLLTLSVLLSVTCLFGCTQHEGPLDELEGSVTIYTTQSDAERALFEKMFTELYPQVEINWVHNSLANSIAQLELDKNDPQCDVIIGGLMQSDGDLYTHLFQQYTPRNIEEQLVVDDDHYYQYYVTQVMTFLVNVKKLEEIGMNLGDIKGYDSLLDERLKGSIISADPTTAAVAWRQLCTMLAIYGQGNYSAQSLGWNYVEKLVVNLNGVMTANSADVTRMVDSGEYAVGLSNESACLQRIVNKVPDMAVVYPEEGNTEMAYAAAIIKNCKNQEIAEKIIDYLLSKEYADARAEFLGTSRSTNRNAMKSEICPETEMLKLIELPYDILKTNRPYLEVRFKDVWVKRGFKLPDQA